MASFTRTGSFSDFQKFIALVYGQPDDRLFSLWDLVSNMERFTMRALKGIRKSDAEKLNYNLLIGFSWMMALSNRLQIHIEDVVWLRFPNACSYCGKKPCVCKAAKVSKRVMMHIESAERPKTLDDFQTMFGAIYPAHARSLADAGVHLAEETGEISEAVQVFLGEHQAEQFTTLEQELADYASCVFGVANSAGISVAHELATMYGDNCHICHQSPCACKFSFIARFES